MKRAAFHIEIIIQGSKENLVEDSIAAVLKSWKQDLKKQIFEKEDLKIKVSKIEETELSDNGNHSLKEDSIYRQIADPLLTTHKAPRT